MKPEFQSSNEPIALDVATMQPAEEQNVYSFSRLSTFLSCPFRYFLTYCSEDAKRELPCEAMNRGKEIHETIAKAISEKNLTGLSGRLPSFVEKYLYPNPIVEEEIQIDFGVFRFRGFIDAHSVDGTMATIVDWKSGFMEGDPLQLKCYAFALMRKYSYLSFIKCHFYYTDKDYYTTESFSRQELEEFGEWLEMRLIEMEYAEEFPAKPNGHCGTCGHVGKCHDAQQYDFLSLSNDEDFRSLFSKVLVAEAFAKQGNDLMKQYLLHQHQDSLVMGDQKLYLTSSVTMKKGKLTKKEMLAGAVADVPSEGQEG